MGSRIEGIGRPRVEPSLLPDTMDAMIRVPDRWSLAAMLALSQRMGRPVGDSTGTNLIAALWCASLMTQEGVAGSAVTLLCDDGLRYQQSYFDAAWRKAHSLGCDDEQAQVQHWLDHGRVPEQLLRTLPTAGALSTSLEER